MFFGTISFCRQKKFKISWVFRVGGKAVFESYGFTFGRFLHCRFYSFSFHTSVTLHSYNSLFCLNFELPRTEKLVRQFANKRGTAQVGAPLKVQKSKSFLNMQKKPLLKFHQFCGAKKYPKVKNSQKLFFPKWKQQKPILCCTKHQRTKNCEKKSIFFQSMSPVCRIVSKSLGVLYASKTFGFL